jgi:hypothetical protein
LERQAINLLLLITTMGKQTRRFFANQTALGISWAARIRSVQFGADGDKPVQGDYDGDGRIDTVVFRPSNGVWYLNRSTDGFTAVSFGLASDKPAPTDFDGDGKTDVAVYRSGVWCAPCGADNSFFAVAFGAGEDVSVPNGYFAE